MTNKDKQAIRAMFMAEVTQMQIDYSNHDIASCPLDNFLVSAYGPVSIETARLQGSKWLIKIEDVSDGLLEEMVTKGKVLEVFSYEDGELYSTDLFIRFTFKKKLGYHNIGHPDFEYCWGGEFEDEN